MYGKCRCPSSSSSSPSRNFRLYAFRSRTIAIFSRSYRSSISAVTLCNVRNASDVSVTIGSSAPGNTARYAFWMFRYSDNSIFFGSTSTNFRLSGWHLYSKHVIIVLIPTDFPEPVAPAINKCGIFVKSIRKISFSIVFPNATGNSKSVSANFFDLIID